MELEVTCREFMEKGRELFQYQWNPRAGAVSTTFHIKDKEKVLSILSANQVSTWDHGNIAKADKDVRRLVSYLGGLWDGQMLFTYPGDGVALAIAWWPWLNGQTVSLLFTPMLKGETGTEDTNTLTATFRGWFNA